jgi:hypothetical protein
MTHMPLQDILLYILMWHRVIVHIARHTDVSCESLAMCILTWSNQFGVIILQKRFKLSGQKYYYESYEAKNAI